MRLLREYEHKARINHWCDRCCDWIVSGERYIGQIYGTDNGILVFKTHVDPPCDFPPDPEDDYKKRDLEERTEFALAA